MLKEHGLPVSNVFDSEIKDLPTHRFSKDFNDDYKTLHEQFKQERLKNLAIRADTPTSEHPPSSSQFMSERLQFSQRSFRASINLGSSSNNVEPSRPNSKL